MTIVVVVYVIGLPMQGVAMTSVAADPSAPWSTDFGGPVPFDRPAPKLCEGCGDPQAVGVLCPIVFCIGLWAVVSGEPEFSPPLREPPRVRAADVRPGLTPGPDPRPPRTTHCV